MTGTALALRAAPWITAWEKKIAEIQESVEKMRFLERPYNAMREVILKPPISNDTLELRLMEDQIMMEFTANDTTTREDFWKLFGATHDSLLKSKLIQEGAGTWPSWRSHHAQGYFFVKNLNVNGPHAYCWVVMRIPDDGTAQIKVQKKLLSHTSTITQHEFEFSDPYARPPWEQLENSDHSGLDF